jgi:hypothetical protein
MTNAPDRTKVIAAPVCDRRGGEGPHDERTARSTAPDPALLSRHRVVAPVTAPVMGRTVAVTEAARPESPGGELSAVFGSTPTPASRRSVSIGLGRRHIARLV